MSLKEQITSTLMDLIPKDTKKFVIIDVPDHPNVGDNAIFLGELEFLESNFPNAVINIVDYRSYSSGQYDLLENADCLLFHGGGNFGDLWMRHQQIRLDIMRQFPNKLLIQFPQSIHFDTVEVLEETKVAIDNCTDFTLIVRDTSSQKFALDNFKCHVRLAPDMAFCMKKLVRTSSDKDVFCLLRVDKERLNDKSSELSSVLNDKKLSFLIDDWVVEHAPIKTFINSIFCRAIRKYPSTTSFIQPFYEKVRIAYAKDNLKRGIELLSLGDIVVTDRLHAFILSTLLGIENYVFDSRGGKVGNFHKTWANDFPKSHLVENVQEITFTNSSKLN